MEWLIGALIGFLFGSALVWYVSKIMKNQLKESFQALCASSLKDNNESFMQLAEAVFGKFEQKNEHTLKEREYKFNELVKPINDSLSKVDQVISGIEKERIRAYEGLHLQVKSLVESQSELKKETSNLVQALRSPSTRGRWGEIQLRRVVEMAGMINHCDFFEQQSVNTEQGKLRPDLNIRLPNNRVIVVDAKTSLSAYLESIEASSENVRVQKLHEHAAQVKKHLQQLSEKKYWDQFGDQTPEFVVMFLPGEPFFSAALQYDPALIENAVSKNVIISTPTTLIALLRAVAYGWRQEKLAENAQEIGLIGREIYDRMSTLSSYFTTLGKNLTQAVDSYNKAVANLETRVLTSARKFKDLHIVGTKEEIANLESLDITHRELQAPEFKESSN